MEKILALDVGEKRIGVAVSDLLGLMAQPVGTINKKSNQQAIDEINAIVHREGTQKIVVGLPKNMDGSEGFQAENTRKFINKLVESLEDPEIIFWDERLTSKMARQSLSHLSLQKAKKRQLIDTVAAVHILQGYLDAHK